MATRYFEVIVEGRRAWALGFVEGFLSARGLGGRLVDAEAEGFDCEPLRERVAELLHPSSQLLHLLAPEALLPAIREAVAAGAARGYPTAVRRERPLAGARFGFSLAVASREHAQRIRRLFENLPPGVRLAGGTSLEEVVDSRAAGVELYTPAHDFELRGEGAVEGALDGVVAVYRACRNEELIRVGAATLLPGGS